MPERDRNTPWQGRQSGKSSTRWFGGSGGNAADREHGVGARAGDGKTSNSSILGKIKVVFRSGRKPDSL